MLAALGGAALMAVGLTLTKAWGPEVPPLTLTAWQLTAGGIFLLPIAAIEGLPDAPITAVNIAGYAFLALVGTVFGYFVWFRGIARLDASVVTFLSLLAAVTATIIAWAFLGQGFTPLQLLGAVLALGAVTAVSLAPTKRSAADGAVAS